MAVAPATALAAAIATPAASARVLLLAVQELQLLCLLSGVEQIFAAAVGCQQPQAGLAQTASTLNGRWTCCVWCQ
jgi:hypothetical protein